MANIAISEIQQEISNPADLDGNELFLISDVNDRAYTSCKVKLDTVKGYIEDTLPKQPGYVKITPPGNNTQVNLNFLSPDDSSIGPLERPFTIENNVFICKNSIVEFGKITIGSNRGSFANIVNCTIYIRNASSTSYTDVYVRRVVKDDINWIHIYREYGLEPDQAGGLYIHPDTLDSNTVIICTTQKVYKRNGEIVIENLE